MDMAGVSTTSFQNNVSNTSKAKNPPYHHGRREQDIKPSKRFGNLCSHGVERGDSSSRVGNAPDAVWGAKRFGAGQKETKGATPHVRYVILWGMKLAFSHLGIDARTRTHHATLAFSHLRLVLAQHTKHSHLKPQRTTVAKMATTGFSTNLSVPFRPIWISRCRIGNRKGS